MKALLYLGAAAIAVYAVLCLLLYLMQDRLLYYPPPQLDHPGARVMRVACGEATLQIWVLHPDALDALIYFGGNAERVGDNLAAFDSSFPDRAVYLVNYRGYDGSTGQPSEAALIGDAGRVFDAIAGRHPHICVVGRSLGSGVAAALAGSRPLERLVLVTPFDSIANVAADYYWWAPVRWLLKDRFDSVPRLARARAPVLVVIAEHDEIVSRARTDALLAAIPESQRHVVLISGATHNDIDLSPAYLSALREFVSGRETGGSPATQRNP